MDLSKWLSIDNLEVSRSVCSWLLMFTSDAPFVKSVLMLAISAINSLSHLDHRAYLRQLLESSIASSNRQLIAPSSPA